MKKLVVVLLVFFGLATAVVAAEFDNTKVKGIDTAIFAVGRNSTYGTFCYVVDRTTGMCFAGVASSSMSLTKVDCEPLKKIEVIKVYLETGKMP